MIQIQIPPVFDVATILAGVGVPLENILAGQLHLFFGNSVKKHEDNDPGNPDPEADGSQGILPLIVLTEFPPTVEVEGPEIIPRPVALHDLGVPHVQQAERPANRTDMDGLPETVQNQNTMRLGHLHSLIS
jgi:hypothetical protein